MIGIIDVNGQEFNRLWQEEDQTEEEFIERMREEREYTQDLLNAQAGEGYKVTYYFL